MAIVGSAQVRITADGTGFESQVKNILQRSAGSFSAGGAEASKNWMSGWDKGASGSGLERSFARMTSNMPGIFGKTGEDAAHEMTSGAEKVLTRDMPGAVQKSMSRVHPVAANQGGIAGQSFGRGFMRTSVTEIDKGASEFAKAFALIYARLATVGTAIGGLAGGVSSLVGGLGQVVIAAGSAASSLAGIGPAIGALVQGGAAVGIAFRGVGKAVADGLKVIKVQQDQVAKSTNAAATGAISAQRAAGNALISAQRAVADAQKRIVDVQIRNARSLADANGRVLSSEKDLLSSQRDLTNAQRALNAARKDGIEELQQLAFSAEDAALAEERAGLSLQDSFTQLKAVQNLPADNRTRVEAELSFKEADLAYREAKDRANDTADAQEEASKKGVEGTKAYTSAVGDIVAAQNKVLASEKALQNAIVSRQQVQVDNARSLADAQQNLSRQLDDLARAHQNLIRAQKELVQAQKGAIDGTSKLSTANQAFADSMKKLSKPAQDFVRFILASQGALNNFKKAIQVPFFTNFNAAFRLAINTLLPGIQNQLAITSGIMGTMGAQIIRGVVGNLGLFNRILAINNGILGTFTKSANGTNSAVQNLVVLFGRVYTAIAPLAQRFADFITKMLGIGAAITGTEAGMKRLTDFFARAGDRMAAFGRIFGQLAGVFAGLARAAAEPVDAMLKSIEDSFASLNQTVAGNQKSLTAYFTATMNNLRPLFVLLGQVGLAFLSLGANPHLGEAFTILQGAIKPLQDIFKASGDAAPALAKLVVAVVNLLAAFADSGAMKVFFDLLTTIVNGVTAFFNTPFGQGLILVLGPVIAVFKVISLLTQGLSKGWQLVKGGALNTLSAIQSLFRPITALTDTIQLLVRSLKELGSMKVEPKIAAPPAGGGAPAAGGRAPRQPRGPVRDAGPAAGANQPTLFDEGAAKKAGATATAVFKDIAKAATTSFGEARTAAAAAYQQGIEDNARRARGEQVGFFADMSAAAKTAFGSMRNLGTLAANDIGTGLGTLKTKADDAFKNLPTTAKTAAGNIIIAFDNVTGAVSNGLKGIPGAVSGAWRALPDLARTTAGNIVIAYDKVVDGVVGAFRALPGAASNAFNAVRGAATRGLDNLVGAAVNTQKKVVDTFQKIGPGIRGAFAATGSLARSGFKGVGNAAQAGFGAARGAAASGLDSIKRKLKDTFNDLGKSAKSGFGILNREAKKADDGVGGGGGGRRAKKEKIDIDTGGAEKKGRGLMGLFGSLGGIIGKLGPILGIVGVVVGIVAAAFSKLMANSKPLQEAMTHLQTLFQVIVAKLLTALVPVIQLVANEFVKLVPVVIPIVIQIINIITQLISKVAAQLIPIFQQMMPVVINVVKTIFGVIAKLIPALVPLIMMIANTIAQLLPAIMPIIQVIIGLFIKFLIPVIQALLPVVMTVINAVIGLFTQLVPVIMPIVMTILDLLTNTLIPVFQLLMPIIMQVISVVIGAIRQLLPVVLPIFTLIIKTVASLLIPVFKALMPVVITVINAVIGILKVLLPIALRIFTAIIHILLAILIPAFRALMPVVQWVMKKVADLIIAGLKVFGWVWDHILKPAIDIFMKGFRAIPTFIDGIVKGIGKFWNNLVETVKKPARALLTGINDWLLKPLNAITSKFGLEIRPIAINFAEGGPVVGPGGPKDDKVKANLSDGEFVLREKASRRIGMRRLMYMNKTGMIPGLDAGGGGIFDIGGAIKSGWNTIVGAGAGLKDLLLKGVEKAFGAVYDSATSGLSFLRSNDDFVSKLILSIVDHLKSYVMNFGRGADAEATKEKQDVIGDLGGRDFGIGTGKVGGDVVPFVRRAGEILGRAFGFSSVFTYPGHQPDQQHALDFMIKSKSQGEALSQFVSQHPKDLNILYMIWNRRMWRDYAHGGQPAHTWAPYFDGNNPNPNRAHTNHVHLSFDPTGKMPKAEIALRVPGGGAFTSPGPGIYGDVKFDNKQLTNAAIIATVASRMGLGLQGIVVGLATAMQESNLLNLNYGDRDSVGLFQQRGSWGSRAQRTDPWYAATAFYQALKRIKGWPSMPVTRAAQKVQISAFPNAYAKWENEARAIAAALGAAPAGPDFIPHGGSRLAIWPTTSKALSPTYPGHSGIDVRVSYQPVWAPTTGSVEYQGWGKGYGQAMFLRTMGITHIFGHLSRITKKIGDVVGQGTRFGTTGNTGHSTGPHLHLEVADDINKRGRSSNRRKTIDWYNYHGVALKLAQGGIIRATPGGVAAILAEAGRPERVEPLDTQGMSERDRSIIQQIVTQMRGPDGNESGQISVRVYIGERELTDIVNTQVDASHQSLTRSLISGRRKPS
jgi:murein DD-endopeptidase MepM/ murein hydrolase activator NlpD/phage-related protein